jgi:hypothetical protein
MSEVPLCPKSKNTPAMRSNDVSFTEEPNPEYSLANGPTLEPFSPEAGPSWVRSSHPPHRTDHPRLSDFGLKVQGYLAHKKSIGPPPPGPRNQPTVGS